MRRSLAAMAVIAAIVGCGPSSINNAAATPSSIAIQPADVPTTLQKCAASGSMDSFLNMLKGQNQTLYANYMQQWDLMRKDGATSAEVVYYTESKSLCDSSASSGGATGAPAPGAMLVNPVVINIVIQFKDESSAINGYQSDSILGFDQATVEALGGAGLSRGASTGLGANSMTSLDAAGKISYYFAMWQNKSFMVIAAILNLDPATAKKIALTVNGRIH